MKKRVSIGLDCGLKTGYATWDRVTERFISIETTDFWTAFDDIQAMYPPESCDVIIEDSKLNGAALRRTGIPAQDIKIAYNSGSNRRESQLLAEGLRRRGYNVVTVKPLRHVTAAGATNKRGKMTAEFFSRLTGWDKPTSEHGRDAGILCWGVKECRQQESEKVA